MAGADAGGAKIVCNGGNRWRCKNCLWTHRMQTPRPTGPLPPGSSQHAASKRARRRVCGWPYGLATGAQAMTLLLARATRTPLAMAMAMAIGDGDRRSAIGDRRWRSAIGFGQFGQCPNNRQLARGIVCAGREGPWVIWVILSSGFNRCPALAILTI